MTPETKAIERAMASLQEAYNVLNDLLPNDGKREQLKAKGEDYGSKRILKVVSDIFSIKKTVEDIIIKMMCTQNIGHIN
jgi:hypothetical protein